MTSGSGYINIPPKEYFNKKRLSKVDALRSRDRLFTFKRGSKGGHSSRSRKSVSPSSRKQDRNQTEKHSINSSMSDYEVRSFKA